MAFYTIHPRDIEGICFKKKPVIIDIREPEEYRAYHLKGARNVPYSDEPFWIQKFKTCRPLLLYCEYGSTSLLAARKLGKEGFEVYTVIGGVNAIRKEFG